MHEAGEGSNAVWQPNTSTADSRTPLANDLTLDNRLNPETDVMLRVECMFSRQDSPQFWCPLKPTRRLS